MDEVLKIVILDQNANSADRTISATKSLGFAVRETIISSLEELEDATENINDSHLVIYSTNIEELTITDIRAKLNKDQHEIPVIVLIEGEEDIAELLANGATTVIPSDNHEQIKHVINQHAQTELYIRNLESVKHEYSELDQRYNRILDSSRDAICYIHEGMHSYVNQSYLDLFSIDEPEDAHVTSILELVSSDDHAEVKSILKKVSKERTSGTASLHFKTGEDDYQQFECGYNPVSVDGETCIQLVIYQNTDGAVELQEQLSYMSEHDIETGFLHRKSIIYKVESVVEAAHANQQNYAFIQIDIANIDDIRDRHGLKAVDQLHASIANALKSVCGHEDLLAKITDESFVILTPVYEEEALKAFGKTIKSQLRQASIEIDNQEIAPDCYIGAALIDSNTEDVSDVLASAKSACDQAWENELHDLNIAGKESVSLTGTMLDQKWSQELQNAIQSNRLTLLFQPVVSITGQTGDKYQVFTQLLSPEGAKISVAEVLPSIERSGVSVMLDRWVISNSIKRLSKHGSEHPDSTFFIKLTAGSLGDSALADWVAAQCKEYQVATSRLVFDIREETIVGHLKEARDLTHKLHEVGCQIAIDAFGMGQSPDKILGMIPATYLKLSFQLMSGIKSGKKENIDAIREICEQAKSKDAKIIAQFVESAQILSTIWTMSIDFAAGDFFQKPSELLEYDFSSAA